MEGSGEYEISEIQKVENEGGTDGGQDKSEVVIRRRETSKFDWSRLMRSNYRVV